MYVYFDILCESLFGWAALCQHFYLTQRGKIITLPSHTHSVHAVRDIFTTRLSPAKNVSRMDENKVNVVTHHRQPTRSSFRIVIASVFFIS